MDLKQQILHYYRVDELSLREIARRTGTDRKTVTRLINAYEAAIKENPETGIEDFLADRPKYKSRTYTPRVVRDAVAQEIDKWLKENDRRRNNGMRKQCLKCTDIHREQITKGLDVSYSSVCKYVHKKKSEKSPKPKDVYLRIHREPGEECEFDWGEVKLFIDKKKVTLMMAVFCMPYSTLRYAYLFHRQDTLAFMESHRNFFRDVGSPRKSDLLPVSIKDVEDYVVVVRGVPVIADADVAALYGVETKRVNEAVRNNPDKFPSGYSFELNVRELRGLRTKISSTNISTKNRNPTRVFSERGLYMLATWRSTHRYRDARFGNFRNRVFSGDKLSDRKTETFGKTCEKAE